MRLGDEIHAPITQRRVRERDVGDEVVEQRYRVIELGCLGEPEHDRRRAALEESHAGHLKEERHAERVAVEADGAIEVLRADEDLTDRGEAEPRSSRGHSTPSRLPRAPARGFTIPRRGMPAPAA